MSKKGTGCEISPPDPEFDLSLLRVDRKRLVWLMTNWCTRNPKSFTFSFRSQYQRTRKELFPVLSRVQDIGYELGENNRTVEWYRANHRTPWMAGECHQAGFSFSRP
jgi:hypothetical protein